MGVLSSKETSSKCFQEGELLTINNMALDSQQPAFDSTSTEDSALQAK